MITFHTKVEFTPPEQAWNEGYDACRGRKKSDCPRNPYNRKTHKEEHKSWKEGSNAAQFDKDWGVEDSD